MSTRTGIVVLNWNGGVRTHACLDSIRTQAGADTFVVLVDNASKDAEREQLDVSYGSQAGIELLLLNENRGYAGGCNAGIARAVGRGAAAVLIVTHDVTLLPGALTAMSETCAADTRIGVVGPEVRDARTGRVISRGERFSGATLCVPRTVLRHRRARFPWYEVSGIMGCAMLLTRRCVEVVGSFDEQLFAYFEEVDWCLRARRHGFLIACTPRAVVTHDGMRGFLGGFGPISAELKARNLPRLMCRWARPTDWVLLLPTYCCLLASSIALYGIRGRMDIVSALVRGTIAAIRGRSGPLDSMARAR